MRARAFVFAAEEDFGIAPVEAHACGTPVIAFGRGGATETVIDGETGVLFRQQTPEAIVRADSAEINSIDYTFGDTQSDSVLRDFVTSFANLFLSSGGALPIDFDQRIG
jgi:hypothetical protein